MPTAYCFKPKKRDNSEELQGGKMSLGRFWHFLRYGAVCSAGMWDTRQALVAKLKENGYTVSGVPNPSRLNASKEGEEFLIDIIARVPVVPIKWADDYPGKPNLVKAISNSGRYGIWNKESKYLAEINKLCQGLIKC